MLLAADDRDDLDRFVLGDLEEREHRRVGQARADELADRDADAGLDDEREGLGLGDQRSGGVLQRLDDAPAEAAPAEASMGDEAPMDDFSDLVRRLTR